MEVNNKILYVVNNQNRTTTKTRPSTLWIPGSRPGMTAIGFEFWSRTRLVSRFRSSPEFAARSAANFGIIGRTHERSAGTSRWRAASS
jgi:hypothetical protein